MIITKNAEKIEPAAAEMVIINGLSFNNSPSGIATHNSATLATNTQIILIKFKISPAIKNTNQLIIFLLITKLCIYNRYVINS